jgi:hypothetical protein
MGGSGPFIQQLACALHMGYNRERKTEQGVLSLGLVDITDVSAKFFITSAIFILIFFGLLSMGILRLFQLRTRSGIMYIVSGVITLVVFIFVLNTWLV